MTGLGKKSMIKESYQIVLGIFFTVKDKRICCIKITSHSPLFVNCSCDVESDPLECRLTQRLSPPRVPPLNTLMLSQVIIIHYLHSIVI